MAWERGQGLREVYRPMHVSVSLQDIVRDEDVIRDLFEQAEAEPSAAVDTAVDRLNDRFGRGSITAASALRSKTYLDHARIPFGQPTDMR